MSEKKIIVIKPEETRIDILTNRIYKNPNNFRRLLKAKPQLNIFDIKAGMVIEAPNNG